MPFVARLDYLGLIDLWTDGCPHVQRWWAHAQAWPSFISGLHDLITENEFTEMRTHGPKILATALRRTLMRFGATAPQAAARLRPKLSRTWKPAQERHP